MGTPHRGLPPPAAMTLPDPGRGPPPIPPPSGSLPPAPSHWQGAEEPMKNWLMAKAEEDKRKQEEEKTRQEGLRLEQRRIEQSMLRESMQGGIPPHLVPMIFAGIGGGNLANMSIDWLQQYMAQLQTAQQQVQQPQQPQTQTLGPSQVQSPELRRETRLINQAQPVLPGQPLAQPQHAAFSSPSYASGSLSPRRAAQTSAHVGAPTSAPRPPAQSQLPRLTTNEIQIQQPPAAPATVQQLQQTHSAHQEQSSPSIYFHHWVPPTSQEKSASGNPPATPSDYTSSPKKRKAQGGHHAPPPPTSAPQSHTSPSFSHVSTSSTSTPGRRGHARARSDASTRGLESYSGSLSRRGTISSHGHAEAGSLQADALPPVSVSSEQRFQQPPRGAEAQATSQQHGQPHPGPPQRNDGPGSNQHGRAATPTAAVHSETRQSGPHQQSASGDRGVVLTSPKREASGQ
ncbi:uncharacterized protein BDR25DRAFT_10004 [Lindgomyces ingoldianus]|uniref:Uncharacterized protein n=1 Tax=Lindgomyces ingoldianus TaxID=673940 RepID=A0ACB6RHV5_9PLEO|nr:uncharacterized protein BDR25DRAFT_10004 [Lindgomyces ingoldianus]KAF2478315.1 hypothetical protein BDR25DRAFT_10004 [Lindgomyces ingoldianus]